MIYFSIKELCKSETAEKKHIANIPNEEERANLVALIDNVLDPCREEYGQPIKVTSGFRCDALNSATGGVKGSQHRLGHAADIVSIKEGLEGNYKIGQIIAQQWNFDQLIFENVDKKMRPQWIHVSYKSKAANRHQILKKLPKGGYAVIHKKDIGL